MILNQPVFMHILMTYRCLPFAKLYIILLVVIFQLHCFLVGKEAIHVGFNTVPSIQN